MIQKLRVLLKSRLGVNIVTLYGVQACTYVLPVITFPYLAHVLKPQGWGEVVFLQSMGGIIALLVEYGFDLSATRETARNAENKTRLRELVAGVLGAKLLLSVIGVAAAVIARPATLKIAPSLGLFWASMIWGVGQGINMLWYFQGLQRMRWAGALDISGKIIATLSIFLVVHTPADGWKVMAAQAIGCGLSHAITVVVAYREVGFCWPSARLIKEALVLGWPMFLFRASQLLTAANGLILGFFASPAAVGLYAGADKFRQVANQALWPISQALFPMQSQDVQSDRAGSAKRVRTSIFLLGGLSSLFGLILALAAPYVVRLVLGPAFLGAVPVLRMFGLLIPLITVCTVIAFQWMLPLGLDRQFNYVVFSAGVVNVVAGVVLAWRYSAVGMAAASVVMQSYTLIAFEYVLRRSNLSPFSRWSKNQAVHSEKIAEAELISQG